MASGVQMMKTGAIAGTGSAIDVTVVGFRPRRVDLFNGDGTTVAFWTDTMADAAGVKIVTAGTISVMTAGITPLCNGFTIGTDADLNASGEVINWVAYE